MIVIHGGGFVIGTGMEDARWIAAVTRQLGAVVIAVSYRLAPAHPFPIAVEDCADAILYISKHLVPEYDIDPEAIYLSGFSAGANLALASVMLLQTPSRWGHEVSTPPPRIRGITMFYPVLDWSLSLSTKYAGCSKPDLALPQSLMRLFDQSYLHPRPDLTDLRLSPGIAPDEYIDALPPIHMCLCEYDVLLTEGLLFGKRLEGRGKKVSWRVVKEEQHGWDKGPRWRLKESVGAEYKAAIEEMRGWMGD